MKPADRAYALVLSLLCAATSNTRAEIIAATHVDWSNSGYIPASPPEQPTAGQAPVNGFSYGVYPSETGTQGPFTLAMVPYSDPNGIYWIGSEGGNTPAQSQYDIHPGLAGSTVVRRYTVASGNEPIVSGTVRVVGRFFELNHGFTHVFVTSDPDGDSSPAARTTIVPSQAPVPTASVEVTLPKPVTFDVTLNVSPGTTIDFGALGMDGASADSTGLVAWIVNGSTAVPTNLLSSPLESSNWHFSNGYQDFRGLCYGMATDGVTGDSNPTTFELAGGGYPYQYGGLLYLENANSGKATRFDSMRIDVTAAKDFAQPPSLYLLRHNSDPGSINPVADDRYERLPVQAVRHAANATDQPYYTFDLTTLPGTQRAGYGFAICGSSVNNGTAIEVSEISAVATRVAASEVVPTKPFYVQWSNGHRYGVSTNRGSWEEVQAEAILQGAHLVTFGAPESGPPPVGVSPENAFVAQTFTDPEGWYIGLKQNLLSPTYLEPAGGWEWVNGDPYAPNAWNSTEPNAFFGAGEDYGMMILSNNSSGVWYDTKVVGYPETSNYRGIVEIDSPGAGERNFFLSSIHARSNIFDAGLASPTQGGTLPPSIDLTGLGGKVLRFPKIHGTLNTAVDFSGPDGAHTPGRSCDLTAVGGISGYLNGNNTPALVGVFLGASQPATPPARLDFSASQIGENFTTLAPALGQVFFIGDGLTSNGAAQQFTIPAGAEKLYFGYPDGHTGELYHGPPLGWGDNSGSISLRATIAPESVPTLAESFPITGGQIHVSGGTGPFTFTILSGSLPPGLSLSPSGMVSGTAGNGPYTFTVKVTDANGATFNRSFSSTIENPIPVPTSLVSWWAAEGSLADIIGNNHGSMKNGLTSLGTTNTIGQNYTAGKVGRAFVLDGVNDFIQVAHDPSQNITGDLTIEGWIKPTANSADEPTIIGKRSADNSYCTYVLYLKAGGQLAFASRNGGTWNDIGTPSPVTLNQWSHVAVTLGGGQLRFFVNGTQVHSVSYVTTRPAVTEPLTIGATLNAAFPESNPSGPFPGSIDELALYSRALSTTEISALYLAGSGGKARYDAARDFSPTSNPGSIWSYRQQLANALDTPYNPTAATLMGTPSTSAPLSFWAATASVSLNNTDAYYYRENGSTRHDWIGRQFGMGPGPGGERPLVRWTAPVTGQYAVSGSFAGADSRPSTVDVHIFHNATELTPSGKRYVNTYRGDGTHHTQVISAIAGDTVDFMIGIGNGDWSYDSAAVSASVTLLNVTPQPRIAVEQPAGTSLVDGNSTISHGAVTLGGAVNKTVTLRNTGTATLSGLAVTVDGPNASEFVASNLSATTLAPGATLTFNVNFTPTASGPRGAALHIASNDAPRSPFDIALTGSGYSAVGNKLYAWGENVAGELGDGTRERRASAVPVIMTGALASKQVTQVFTPGGRTHALTADGKIYSWGYNASGQLGDGTTTYSNEPVAMVMNGALAGKTVVTLAGSTQHGLALTADGKVYSWGENFGGHLGLGDTTDRHTPQLVQGALASKTITAISGSTSHSLVLASDGTVYGWGNNMYGTVGDGTTTTRLSPVAANFVGTPAEGKTVVAVRAGYYCSFVLTNDGKLFGWGFNGNAMVGDGTTVDRLRPVAVNGGSIGNKTVTTLSGGDAMLMALTSDGQLHGWGGNTWGNMGLGNNITPIINPTQLNATGVLAGKTITQIVASSGTSMLRTSDGGFYAFGMGYAGQLGNGVFADVNTPVAVDLGGALAGRTLVNVSSAGSYTVVVAYAPPAPEIVVENEVGTALVSSEVYRQDFGPVLPTKHKTAAIIIRNTGDDLLGNIAATIDGPNAADFSVSSSSSGTTLTPSGTQTLTITFTPSAQGTREATLHITSNDADEPAYTITLAGLGAQPISEWREQFFESTEGTGDAADNADPDDDGVENLLEFATGADPTESSPIETPVSKPVAGTIGFTYTRNKLATAEVVYAVEWSDTLVGGWSSNGVSETVIADDGTLETVLATLPAGSEGRFIHLKVTRH